MNKVWDGWKKVQDYLRKMPIENLDLFNEYVKSMKDNYSILQVSFKNRVRQVEFFHSGDLS